MKSYGRMLHVRSDPSAYACEYEGVCVCVFKSASHPFPEVSSPFISLAEDARLHLQLAFNKIEEVVEDGWTKSNLRHFLATCTNVGTALLAQDLTQYGPARAASASGRPSRRHDGAFILPTIHITNISVLPPTSQPATTAHKRHHDVYGSFAQCVHLKCYAYATSTSTPSCATKRRPRPAVRNWRLNAAFVVRFGFALAARSE